jgi:phenylalanyl-tRNA synthetase beta chain
MKIPVSWLKDFIDLDGLSIEDIARKLTLAGMEVDEILYAGLPMPVYKEGEKHEFKTNGIAWDKEKIVVAEIREVKDHPNADKLTLLDLFDGQQDQVVLTGAPNIFHLKGKGKLDKPINTAGSDMRSNVYAAKTAAAITTYRSTNCASRNCGLPPVAASRIAAAAEFFNQL